MEEGGGVIGSGGGMGWVGGITDPRQAIVEGVADLEASKGPIQLNRALDKIVRAVHEVMCVCVRVYVRVYVCVYVCVYECMYVCVYVCM